MRGKFQLSELARSTGPNSDVERADHRNQPDRLEIRISIVDNEFNNQIVRTQTSLQARDVILSCKNPMGRWLMIEVQDKEVLKDIQRLFGPGVETIGGDI